MKAFLFLSVLFVCIGLSARPAGARQIQMHRVHRIARHADKSRGAQKAHPSLRIRYRLPSRRVMRSKPRALSARPTPTSVRGPRTESFRGVHAIVSLPPPPDEIATVTPSPVNATVPPSRLSTDVSHPSADIHTTPPTTSSPAPSPAAPSRSMTYFAGVPEVQPVTLPSIPGAPLSHRLLSSPSTPPPTTRPDSYTLPNHVLPLSLELQLASSINASGKGPLATYGANSFHLGASAAGVITTTINSTAAQLPQQFTTTSPGVALNFGKRSAPWWDFSVNYQFSRFTESYVSPQRLPMASVPFSFQEISAEYIHTWSSDTLFSNRPRPFVGVGAGGLIFTPSNSQLSTQIRTSAVLDVGVDIPLHSERVSFRTGAHMLVYKAPDFKDTALSSNRWVATTEPAAGIYFHF